MHSTDSDGVTVGSRVHGRPESAADIRRQLRGYSNSAVALSVAILVIFFTQISVVFRSLLFRRFLHVKLGATGLAIGVRGTGRSHRPALHHTGAGADLGGE